MSGGTMERKAILKRKTNETDIIIKFDLDGGGKSNISTPYAFFDHLLSSFTKHGRFDLDITAKGDTEVGCHHLVEDVGICLGNVLKTCMDNKKGIQRFGSAIVPMDDSEVTVSMDLGGRPYLRYNVDMAYEMLEGVETIIFKDFFEALVNNALINLHINKNVGLNPHHILEAIFKSFGIALHNATRISYPGEIPSTKGVL